MTHNTNAIDLEGFIKSLRDRLCISMKTRTKVPWFILARYFHPWTRCLSTFYPLYPGLLKRVPSDKTAATFMLRTYPSVGLLDHGAYKVL